MKSKWNISLLSLLLCGMQISVSHKLMAQQDPIFSKYMFNPLVINPAYAGSRETVSTVLVHRSQWVGFEGAPSTQTLSIHSPLAQKKLGVGFGIVRDQLGPSLNYGIHGSLAYRIKMGIGKFSMALRAAAYNYAFDWSLIDFKDSDQLNRKVSYWLPSFDLGLRYHDRKFYAGLAFSHLNQPTLVQKVGIDSINNPSELIPHINLNAGYAYKLSQDVVFKPSILINYATSGLYTADFNASVLLNSALWLGASYRTSKVLIAIVQYDVSNAISLGYSYDATLSRLRKQDSGSHEIFLRYEFELNKSKVLSPRYF